MEEQNKIAALEAVLFTIGDSVEVGKLAEVIGEDVRTTKKLLARLQERYEKEDSGIMLSVLENSDGRTAGDTFHHCLQAACHKNGD